MCLARGGAGLALSATWVLVGKSQGIFWMDQNALVQSIVLELVSAFASPPLAHGRLRGFFQQGGKKGCECKYLYSQYNSNLQYAYPVRTCGMGQIFLVEDANFYKNPIFLCQSKSFWVQTVCQD